MSLRYLILAIAFLLLAALALCKAVIELLLVLWGLS